MTDAALQRLQSACAPVLDAAGFIAGPQAEERYCQDWSGARGTPLAVLRPREPGDVAAVMTILHALAQPVVIQGGMTGLVGACVPQAGEVVLSLERLRSIEAMDTDGGTVTAQAGVPLETLQRHVEERGWMFPVDIGARGSCQIGGIIATNAGGNRVLRYGMTRQSVLGLEVVLPDGSIVSRMGTALKDNAGYDLKHMFIGSEGTLGVITRAVLALQPLPASRQTALVSVAGFDQVVALLKHCRLRLGARLTSFEVMWRDYYDTVTVQLGKGKAPFQHPGSHLVLVETMGSNPGADATDAEQVMVEFLEQVPSAQVVLAQSLAEAAQLWAIRDAAGEAAMAVRPWAGFDVSLPLARMESWARDIHAGMHAMGYTRLQTYGHLGDGNLHLVVGDVADAAGKERVADLVHRTIGALGGSISGEHGIGFSKKCHLGYCRSTSEIALMQSLKQTLDPHQLLNRGRVFDLPATPT
jgi:FAD/FMN-containing dehydrogenase